MRVDLGTASCLKALSCHILNVLLKEPVETSYEFCIKDMDTSEVWVSVKDCNSGFSYTYRLDKDLLLITSVGDNYSGDVLLYLYLQRLILGYNISNVSPKEVSWVFSVTDTATSISRYKLVNDIKG